MKKKVGIIKNGSYNFHYRWIESCKKINLDYKVIDLFSDDWLEQVTNETFDVFLLRPPGIIDKEKYLFDERIFILAKILNLKTYPKFHEVKIYENKKLLRDYLIANNIPHPEASVFFDRVESENYIKNTKFPIVGKTSIGASGSGVVILKSKKSALKYVDNAFGFKGVKARHGPNRNTGNPVKWSKKSFKNPKYLVKKIKEYYARWTSRQKGFVIFQEYIPHSFEWRAVKIGESYFAHKKIKTGEMASGTKGIEYVDPPLKLLDYVKDLSDKLDVNSMAFDLFEYKNQYLVNEMQTIFGHVQDHICEVNGKPGRFLFLQGKWVFEEGSFNSNESYDLRLKDALKAL